ncbi:MAG: putative secreted protein [Belnapia sp.]|nr:putative secreted protein [Belnapia sp.]
MTGWVRRLSPLLALWLVACGVVDFTRPGTGDTEATYAGTYRYYAEFCALSQISKRPGFGAEIRGEIGGHAVFYLHGACRGTGADPQVLRLCEAGEADGVGISMNEHFRNAKWVAIPGRDFFFDGGLPRGEPLTRAAYRRTQAEARRLGIYDGIEFHPRYFEGIPADTTAEAYKYELSVATDYALSHGRGRYCARVPVNQAQLVAMIGFLNAENAPYRSGAREFRWSLFQDNCIHLAHNALAVAGVWPEWPTNRPLLVSFFDFPVPKNEFVNLMRRANDTALLDPLAAWRDPAARRAVLEFGQLPVRPGTIALSWPAREPNEVYETALKLVFYDEPHLGPYRFWLDAILADPERTDLAENLRLYAARYRQQRAAWQPLPWWLAQPEFRDVPPAAVSAFRSRFAAALGRDIATVERQLAQVERARAVATLGQRSVMR